MQNATVTSLTNYDASRFEAKKLGNEIIELCSYLYAAESRLLTLIREFDEKEYWADLGLHSCAHWLNFKCGIGMGAAREKVRVARALATLPKIEKGMSQGQLSYSKVRAMTRIADESNEDYLLMIAKHGTAHHVEKLVSKYRTAKRLQDADAVEAQYRDRELEYYHDHNGCLVIKARMPAEQGALIVKALEMAMDKNHVGARHAGDKQVSVGARHAGDKSLTVRARRRSGRPNVAEHMDVRERRKGEDVPAGTSSTDEPVAARRADALAEIAETYMNNDESSGSTADRYQVVVHVTAETSQIEDGPHVPAGTSRRIGCDSSIVTIKEDEKGEPLSIGRRSRTIPPSMRRALRSRDGGCRFPGCTNTKFVDGHHIKHWADGGETSLSNLVSLCRRHHHLVHEGGFRCEKSAGGEVYFTDQGHRPLPSWSNLPKVTSDHDVQQWMDREFFEATENGEGCDAKWYAGDKMDWHMAVSALFEIEHRLSSPGLPNSY